MLDAAAHTKAGFLTVAEVPEEHLGQVRAAEAEFTKALDTPSGAFEFARIQGAAKDLPGASTVRIIPGFGLADTVPGHVMVLTLREAVRQALSRPFGNEAFWERAEAALTRTFSNLAEQEAEAHLRFTPQTQETRETRENPQTPSTHYDYHLLFALADDETEDDLYLIAFCVHVTVGMERERALGLSVEDPAPYTLRLDALCVRQPLGEGGVSRTA